MSHGPEMTEFHQIDHTIRIDPTTLESIKQMILEFIRAWNRRDVK